MPFPDQREKIQMQERVRQTASLGDKPFVARTIPMFCRSVLDADKR
jgi:hypothetical protein